MNRRQMLCGAAAAFPLLHMSLQTETASAQQFKVDLFRQPDAVDILLGDAADVLHGCVRNGAEWSAPGAALTYTVDKDSGAIALHAPGVAIRRVHLRWKCALSHNLLVLGDAWERSYGDLAWMPIQAERFLPWYCMLVNGDSALGMGVATGAAAFAFWQIDTSGVSLWLDVRNGGNGVLMKERTLAAATVVCTRGSEGESPFQATRRLCRRMAAGIRLADRRGVNSIKVLMGSNDWYYAYGKNTAEGILRDADLVRELAPDGPTRPFTIIDDGYQDRQRFPDMEGLAHAIQSKEVSPGVWVRPLRAATSTKASYLLPAHRYGHRQERAGELAFDPTVPEARNAVLDVVREARSWGFDLIKHDFTTYELLGQWGSEMGPSPTVDGWSFQDRSLTNAEIITGLYRDIRVAAGEDRIVLGCNTVGHLSAGIFDAQRTGDDVSGRNWERTRRMGVNTLGFRLPQNGVFFATDADCVPITRDVPWSFTKQWLQAVAASGSVLLISPEPGAIGAEQKRSIRAAFSQCEPNQQRSEPADWIHTRTPEDWLAGSKSKHYSWISPDGTSPFSV